MSRLGYFDVGCYGNEDCSRWLPCLRRWFNDYEEIKKCME
jgi:hypothetical protein